MKKGFTLIELLAVIVILAIVALIATPIILDIIKDAKEQSTMRSAENYIDAIEQAIVRKNLREKFNPIRCEIISDRLDCDGIPLEVEIDGEAPKEGTIIKLENGKVTNGTTIIIGGLNLIVEDDKVKINEEKVIVVGNFNSVCELATESTIQGYEAGTKYNCKVDPNKDAYTFYVLKTPTSEATTIDLIMDQNINSDGTPAGLTGVTKEENPNQYNLVAWFNENGLATNEYGPITAVTFLYNATQSWTNVSPLNYEYRDKEEQGVDSDVQLGYTSFKSENGILTITGLSTTTIGTQNIPLRARMPIYSDNEAKTEVFNKTNSTEYLYNNLLERGTPNSYWILSSYVVEKVAGVEYGAKKVGYGYFGSGFVGVVSSTSVDIEAGIRPVITLNI